MNNKFWYMKLLFVKNGVVMRKIGFDIGGKIAMIKEEKQA